MDRPTFSDIVRRSGKPSLAQKWTGTAAAGEYTPLPRGEYVAHITDGQPHQARTTGNAGYRLTFTIAEGPYRGRRLSYDIWFTEAAIPQAKRDLAKLGVPVDDYEALLHWLDTTRLSPGIRCSLKVTTRKEDDGTEYKRVQAFQVVSIDAPAANPFPPPPAATTPPSSTAVASPAAPSEPGAPPSEAVTLPKRKRGRRPAADHNGTPEGGRP